MGDKEWRNGCRTPTQDPSTNNRWLSVGAATSAELAELQYDTNTYAQRAVDLIVDSPASRRLYIHLMWHAVHSPYTAAPAWEASNPEDKTYANYCPPPGTPQTPSQHERCNFGGILKVVDAGMANITDALRASGRWDGALLWVSSGELPTCHRKQKILVIRIAESAACGRLFYLAV